MNRQKIREIVKPAIRNFVAENQKYLRGDVIDYGSGKEPYRQYCENYFPFEKGFELPKKKFDAVLCNQVMQYVAFPQKTIDLFHGILKDGGYLVMTYPTCWEEVEDCDLWRFTAKGMELLCENFNIIKHEPLGAYEFADHKLVCDHGIVCQK
ncbi:MAG: methyltransferase domain-containing protein [Candidatus Moranbacteria bacterium]|nr:methyltransferase domain-containing protein [Candidatus Moranbacteria bacterium]